MILNDICEVYSGYALKKFNENGDGLPVIKIGNILADGTLQLEDCEYTIEKVHDKYYSKKEDIYVALSGATTGKIGINKSDKKYIINQRVGIVRKKDNNIPNEFIKFFLLRQTERILQEAAGCAQPNISPKQIAQYALPDIRSEKMRQIVVVLNRLTSVIVSRKTELQKLDDLIKARFVELFGDLHFNPYDWPFKSFTYLTILITDGEHATPRRVNKGIYLLSARNILNHSIRLDDVDYIDQEEYERIAKRVVPQAGDVLISCSGTVGRCCTVPAGLDFQMVRSVALLRFKDVINPKFAEYMITSDFLQEQINSSKTASSQANLFQGKIAKLKGFVPPMELQIEFNHFIEQVDKSKVVVQKALNEAQLLFDSLMQQYFG